MKTISDIIGISRKGLIAVLVSIIFSMNIFSQFSFNNNELTSFESEMITHNTPEVISIFHHSPLSDLFAIEERLEFEDWMLHPENWSAPKNEISMTPEIFMEEDLNFESWMLETNWIYDDLFTEEEMEFESWMSDLLQW